MSHWICSIVHKSRFRLLRFLVMTSKRAFPDFRLLLFYVQFQKWWSGAHMAGHYLFAYFCIHFWLCLFLLFGFLLSVKWLFQSWYLFLACGCLSVTFNCLAYVTRRVVEVLGFPFVLQNLCCPPKRQKSMGNKSKYVAQITDIYKETYITASKLLEYFILLVEIVWIVHLWIVHLCWNHTANKRRINCIDWVGLDCEVTGLRFWVVWLVWHTQAERPAVCWQNNSAGPHWHGERNFRFWGLLHENSESIF